MTKELSAQPMSTNLSKAQLVNDPAHEIRGGYDNFLLDNKVDFFEKYSPGELDELVLREVIENLESLDELAKYVKLQGKLVVVDVDLGLISQAVIEGKLDSHQLHVYTKSRNLYFAEDVSSHLSHNFEVEKQSFNNFTYSLTFRRIR